MPARSPCSGFERATGDRIGRSDVVAVERVRLTEWLCPEQSDEPIPPLREPEADDDRRHQRGKQLDGPSQGPRDGRGRARKTKHRGRWSGPRHTEEIDMPPEDAEIAPDVEKHDARGCGEKPQPEEEQTPEHGR